MIIQRLSLPVFVIYLSAISLPATAEELDMTMQVLKPGEKPEAIIQRIQLPKPASERVENTTVPQEAEAAIDEVSDDVETLSETTSETVTDNVKDINDGTITLPKASQEAAETSREVIDDTDKTIKESAKAIEKPVQQPLPEPEQTINKPVEESLPEPEQAVDALYQEESGDLSRDQAIENIEDPDADVPPDASSMEEPAEVPQQIIDELPAEEDVSTDNLQETVEPLP